MPRCLWRPHLQWCTGQYLCRLSPMRIEIKIWPYICMNIKINFRVSQLSLLSSTLESRRRVRQWSPWPRGSPTGWWTALRPLSRISSETTARFRSGSGISTRWGTNTYNVHVIYYKVLIRSSMKNSSNLFLFAKTRRWKSQNFWRHFSQFKITMQSTTFKVKCLLKRKYAVHQCWLGSHCTVDRWQDRI